MYHVITSFKYFLSEPLNPNGALASQFFSVACPHAPPKHAKISPPPVAHLLWVTGHPEKFMLRQV